jgi:hypothetical protein
MNWIEIVKAVFSLFPAAVAAIKAIEELLPESNKGADKLELIRTIIIDTDSGVKENWPLVEKIIASVVAFCNKFGIFKTTKKG